MSESAVTAKAEADALAGLEERVQRAVSLVAELRSENAKLRGELDAANAAKSEALQASKEAGDLKAEITRLLLENETMRSERENVRRRVERLLETIDNMGTA